MNRRGLVKEFMTQDHLSLNPFPSLSGGCTPELDLLLCRLVYAHAPRKSIFSNAKISISLCNALCLKGGFSRRRRLRGLLLGCWLIPLWWRWWITALLRRIGVTAVLHRLRGHIWLSVALWCVHRLPIGLLLLRCLQIAYKRIYASFSVLLLQLLWYINLDMMVAVLLGRFHCVYTYSNHHVFGAVLELYLLGERPQCVQLR